MDGVNRIKSAVCIHSHCKYTYEQFNDFIRFDTTYHVNRYNMPFSSFVRINRHDQSILLGCALLTNEDAKNYKLNFETWLKAMKQVAPKAIFTNQCESIKAGVSEVFENDTIHRYCSQYKVAKYEFKNIVLDSITSEEFEQRWGDFIVKYELKENNLFRLNTLYRGNILTAIASALNQGGWFAVIYLSKMMMEHHKMEEEEGVLQIDGAPVRQEQEMSKMVMERHNMWAAGSQSR
ncbi:protein FAR1-RELATED SEQUENCE 2-like [Lycium ferocissimum]|uniref:protein FAR1-RELATED SEQUENCE 2-like n=1 Tax=Lycium ferocissimum TaxID=112874 RepID=UPI0028163BE6|nr:protein FAR1-RELATED SEQUENCE 2-like [Lycium ferocissimum]